MIARRATGPRRRATTPLPLVIRSATKGLQADAVQVDVFSMRTAVEITKELERVIAKAKPVPLTDQVRVDRRQVSTLLAELRQSLEQGRIA